jgi:hypothetical protein
MITYDALYRGTGPLSSEERRFVQSYQRPAMICRIQDLQDLELFGDCPSLFNQHRHSIMPRPNLLTTVISPRDSMSIIIFVASKHLSGSLDLTPGHMHLSCTSEHEKVLNNSIIGSYMETTITIRCPPRHIAKESLVAQVSRLAMQG